MTKAILTKEMFDRVDIIVDGLFEMFKVGPNVKGITHCLVIVFDSAWQAASHINDRTFFNQI